MITFTLLCRAPGCGHEFESCFASGAAYETLESKGLLSCPDCGSSDVGKALMAPSIRRSAKSKPVSEPSPIELMRQARRFMEEHGRNMGPDFAKEARKMAAGESEHTLIYGTSTPEEKRQLKEEGIETGVIPLVPLHDA